jgi:hypothetical protein
MTVSLVIARLSSKSDTRAKWLVACMEADWDQAVKRADLLTANHDIELRVFIPMAGLFPLIKLSPIAAKNPQIPI